MCTARWRARRELAVGESRFSSYRGPDNLCETQNGPHNINYNRSCSSSGSTQHERQPSPPQPPTTTTAAATTTHHQHQQDAKPPATTTTDSHDDTTKKRGEKSTSAQPRCNRYPAIIVPRCNGNHKPSSKPFKEAC